MTTPMQYLYYWFLKDKLTNNYPKETATILAITCQSIDRAIINKVGIQGNRRDLYIDYFCSFQNYIDLIIDLEFNINDYFIKIVEPIFNEKFPIEKIKLQKMWNLKPNGIQN